MYSARLVDTARASLRYDDQQQLWRITSWDGGHGGDGYDLLPWLWLSRYSRRAFVLWDSSPSRPTLLSQLNIQDVMNQYRRSPLRLRQGRNVALLHQHRRSLQRGLSCLRRWPLPS